MDDHAIELSVRLPPDLLAKLTSLAEAAGLSSSETMTAVLAEALARPGPVPLPVPVPVEVVAALAEAVLDSVHTPTRGGQLLTRLDARCPQWRRWIPPERRARYDP